MDAPRSFACPSCKEFINDSMRECRYCGAPVDPAIAASIAGVQEKVNQACSDASNMRHTAVVMMASLGLSFIPFVPLVGWVFLFTFVIVIALFIRWQLKFSGLVTNDPDYGKARRAKNTALVLWVLALPLGFVVRPLVKLFVLGF